MKGLIVTYALSYGGAAIAFVNPWYGLLAYIALSTLKPDDLWFWTVPPGNYTRVAAIGLILGWALHGFGTWNFGRAWPIFFVIVGYWGWIVISAVFAPNQEVAWKYVDLFSKILMPILVGFTLLDSVQRVQQLAWVLVLCIGYVGLEANIDYFTGGWRLRTVGYFSGDNNSACICLMTGCGLAFFLGVGETIAWRKCLCFGIALLLAHCPMFGDSRGGMLGLIATGIATFVLIPKSPRTLALLGIAVVVTMSLAGPSVARRFGTIFNKAEERDESAQSRLDLWANCWHAMRTNPMTGLGPDHFPISAKFDYGWGTAKESHSLWFNTGAELGFPGLGLLLAYYGLTIWRLWRLARDPNPPDPWLGHGAKMVIVSLVGFAVSASFVSLDALEPPYFVVLLGAGILRVATQLEFAQESHDALPGLCASS